jgi:hypothetical protein
VAKPHVKLQDGFDRHGRAFDRRRRAAKLGQQPLGL